MTTLTPTQEYYKTYGPIYYQKNKEIIDEKFKIYYKKNKAHIVQKQLSYYQNNKEKISHRLKNTKKRCDICGCSVVAHNFKKHEDSNKHYKNKKEWLYISKGITL
jgi:hypothetical protein